MTSSRRLSARVAIDRRCDRLLDRVRQAGSEVIRSRCRRVASRADRPVAGRAGSSGFYSHFWGPWLVDRRWPACGLHRDTSAGSSTRQCVGACDAIAGRLPLAGHCRARHDRRPGTTGCRELVAADGRRLRLAEEPNDTDRARQGTRPGLAAEREGRNVEPKRRGCGPSRVKDASDGERHDMDAYA